MTGRRTLTLAVATALTIGAVPMAMGAASASNSGSEGDERASISAKPKQGRYQGKVGTFARIIMKTTPKKIKRLDAGVQASCQRASDQSITRIKLLAIRSTKRIKVKRNGKFAAKGTDKRNDVAWEIKGRFVSRKKAKGYFKASQFNLIFNPFGSFDSELCTGSGKWMAKLK